MKFKEVKNSVSKKECPETKESEEKDKFSKININGVAASSLQAGMNLEETRRFIKNVLGEEPPGWLMEKIREERKNIRESTRSRALGF